MDQPNQPLDAPATFTNADRALLIAVAQKLNTPMPADLSAPVASGAVSFDPTQNATLPPSSMLPPPSAGPVSAPAYDPATAAPSVANPAPSSPAMAIPDGTVLSTPPTVQINDPAASQMITPPQPNAPPINTAPVFNPPNSPALAALPQPAAPPVSRDTKVDFTAGQAADLAAILALIREKFPHALPEEIPSVVTQ